MNNVVSIINAIITALVDIEPDVAERIPENWQELLLSETNAIAGMIDLQNPATLSLTIAAGGVETADILLENIDKIISISAVADEGEKLSSQPYDPSNVSNSEVKIDDEDTTNLVFNSQSSGTVNKELPGLDLGEVLGVSTIRLWWWRDQYIANEFVIQGSDDGTNWMTVTDVLDATGLGQTSQDIAVNTSHRYFRVFCIKGIHPTWVVISEMTCYGAIDSSETIREPFSQTDLILSGNDSSISIINPSNKEHNITIYYKNNQS